MYILYLVHWSRTPGEPVVVITPPSVFVAMNGDGCLFVRWIVVIYYEWQTNNKVDRLSECHLEQ